MNNFNLNEMLNANGIKPLSDADARLQMRIAKVLSDTKTDWNVIKLPLQTTPYNREVSTWNNDSDTLDTTLVSTPVPLTKVVGQKTDGTGGVRRGHFAMVREDNCDVLGVGSEQYTAVQNKDMAEVLCGIQDHFSGMELDVTGEVLDEGRKVTYTLNLPSDVIEGQDKTGKVGHKILRGITLTNSHDGSGSVRFGIFHEVCICSNGMYVNSKGVKKAFRHTGSVLERIKDAVQGFTMMLEEEMSMLNNYKRMAEVEVNEKHIEGIIKAIFKVNKDAKVIPSEDTQGIKIDEEHIKDDKSKTSVKSMNQVNTFITKALIPEFAQKGATMWGLMNAVTQYTNHQVSNSSAEYLILGEGRKKNEKAYNTLLGWLNEPRVEAMLN